MDPGRFREITRRYSELQVAVVGDFCLDRYLEIDPTKREMSIETGLPVYNVVRVRAQPGGAGTILNNLVALGVGTIYPIGFAGEDGEGAELRRALEARAGVRLSHFLQTPDRNTFTYCKPLLVEPGKAPVELNRLDTKNWTPTPAKLQELLCDKLEDAARFVQAMILLDQVDVPETGVVTSRLLASVEAVAQADPRRLVLADSRRGLRGFPPLTFKMNATELAAFRGEAGALSLDEIRQAGAELARVNARHVFITLSERGILGAAPDGQVEHAPALPVRGEIDVVGAGDAVSANLTAALAAGATLREALEIANAAASVVLHKLGTTGTANLEEIGELLRMSPA
jgi:rfaE bifunctional protein kinase chain/domain